MRGEYASVGFDDRFALCHLTRVDAGGRVSVTNQPHYVHCYSDIVIWAKTVR